jgi:hypothetical protein
MSISGSLVVVFLCELILIITGILTDTSLVFIFLLGGLVAILGWVITFITVYEFILKRLKE